MPRWIKRIGIVGLTFFLVKGLAWIALAGLACGIAGR